jgi:hypothetical protein
MKRYTVTKAADSTGGPVTLVDTGHLAEAQHYVYKHGGEVVDHENKRAWSPDLGWYDVSENLEVPGE